MHKLLPANDGRVLGDALDLPPFRQHITRLDGRGQSVLYAGDNDIDHLRVSAHVFKLVVELIQCDGSHTAGFIQIEFYLFFGGERMDHVGDAAHQIHRVEHVNGLWAVGQRYGHLVALAHADGLQRSCTAMDLPHHALVGRGFAHEIKGDVVGIRFGDGLHSGDHGAFKVVKVHGHTAQVVSPRRLHGDLRHYDFPFLQKICSYRWNTSSFIRHRTTEI